MTASYTFDVFAGLDGYGSHRGDWGEQGPELFITAEPLAASRPASWAAGDVSMVFGTRRPELPAD